MRLGIPLWRDEVSPVFDVAAKLLIIDVEDAREVARRVIPLGTPDAPERADRLAAMGIDVLVCGVITRTLEAIVTAAGVRVVSFVCGPVEQVARLIMSGARLPSECLLPGHGQPRVREGNTCCH
jgi:predicted Fe-Mo cluster-binding NifX family protein